MNTFPTDAPRQLIEFHESRASTVIIHRVPADKAERFMELQRSVSRAAEAFAGFRGTEVYPPAEPQLTEWVVIIHFDAPAALQHWLDSPVRAEWIANVRDEVGEFRLKPLPQGFASWFTGETAGPAVTLPPSWKIALTVLLGLYPTVMLLGIFTGPYTSPLGLAVSMLIGNALSISLLQWAVMPVLNTVLGPWVQANADKDKVLSIGGLFLILLLLGILTILFRLVTG
jgi:antibiotic biosynthesis monooxygenase (ABM) superfamily enzyme